MCLVYSVIKGECLFGNRRGRMFYLVLGAGKWSVHGIWQHVSSISSVYLNFRKYVFDI